ncbi:hypothetical protein U1Q18_049113 [Sarracenia purpurea var. burkii]
MCDSSEVCCRTDSSLVVDSGSLDLIPNPESSSVLSSTFAEPTVDGQVPLSSTSTESSIDTLPSSSSTSTEYSVDTVPSSPSTSTESSFDTIPSSSSTPPTECGIRGGNGQNSDSGE